MTHKSMTEYAIDFALDIAEAAPLVHADGWRKPMTDIQREAAKFLHQQQRAVCHDQKPWFKFQS